MRPWNTMRATGYGGPLALPQEHSNRLRPGMLRRLVLRWLKSFWVQRSLSHFCAGSPRRCAILSCAGFLGRGSNALSPRPALIDLGNVAVLGLGQENQRDEETHRCDRHRIPQSRIDLAVAATMANAVAGRKPPNQPLPIW